ncbi:hypothetical protein SmJEL517_g01164 [Synchytrium microbalum]|uniref:Calponin-homology (CH) domain-containing protein n=1 Tax=Synchytrium microbalum TaxID=1806994 RepID=A0A507CAT4_9FUNG|nr:uncharacterized protein SmJEL517_g01164 [Synchytrium microbalum]TPX36732.1 hypothetical protein SmJEL517_g01164 [Synchytrium microbalum]
MDDTSSSQYATPASALENRTSITSSSFEKEQQEGADGVSSLISRRTSSPHPRVSAAVQFDKRGRSSTVSSPKDLVSSSAMAEGLLRQAELDKSLVASESTFNFASLDHSNTIKHHLSDMEIEAYTAWINAEFGNDSRLAHLFPIEPTSLFKALASGLILCKLVNLVKPGTIDELGLIWAVQSPVRAMLSYHENLTKALEGSKKIGCQISNIGADDIIRGSPHLCSGLLWQLIKACAALLSNVKLDRSKGAVTQEAALLAWMNDRLSQSTITRRVTNFTTDLADCECLLHLLNQVSPKEITHIDIKNTLSEADLTRRAQRMLELADRIKCRQFATDASIATGNKHLNMGFLAGIYNVAQQSIGNDNREEMNRLKQELSQAMGRISMLESENKVLKDKCGALGKDVVEAHERAEAASAYVARLDRKIASASEDSQRLQAENDDLVRKLKAAKDENRGLGSDLEELKAKAEKDGKSLSKYKDEVKKQCAERDTLKQELNQSRQERDQLQSHIETCTSRIRALSAENEALEPLTEQVDKLRDDVRQLRVLESQKADQVQKLSAELSFARGTILETQRSLDDQRILASNYKTENDANRREIEGLTTELRSVKIGLENTVGELESAKRGYEQSSTKVKSLKQEQLVLEGVAEECERLKDQIRELKRSEVTAENEIQALMNSNQVLKSDLSNTVTSHAALARESSALKETAASLQSQLDECRQLLASTTSEKETLQAQELKLQESYDAILKQTELLTIQTATTTQDLEDHKRILTTKQDEVTSLKTERDALKLERERLEDSERLAHVSLQASKRDLYQVESRLSELYTLTDKQNTIQISISTQIQSQSAEITRLVTERNSLLKQHEDDLRKYDTLLDDVSRCRDLLATRAVRVTIVGSGSSVTLDRLAAGTDTSEAPLSASVTCVVDAHNRLLDGLERSQKKIARLENAIAVLKDVGSFKNNVNGGGGARVLQDSGSQLMDRLMKTPYKSVLAMILRPVVSLWTRGGARHLLGSTFEPSFLNGATHAAKSIMNSISHSPSKLPRMTTPTLNQHLQAALKTIHASNEAVNIRIRDVHAARIDSVDMLFGPSFYSKHTQTKLVAASKNDALRMYTSPNPSYSIYRLFNVSFAIPKNDTRPLYHSATDAIEEGLQLKINVALDADIDFVHRVKSVDETESVAAGSVIASSHGRRVLNVQFESPHIEGDEEELDADAVKEAFRNGGGWKVSDIDYLCERAQYLEFAERQQQQQDV